jgi:hypothetical protein
MSVSQAITPHIPYLRRFSRAYVFATLEAIVTDPNSFAAAGDLRTALYRLFLKVWGSMPINSYVDQAAVSGEEIGARRNLDAIS